jgi:acetolactate synthase-1/2/3 large subunit
MQGYEVINRMLAEAGVGSVFQYMAEDTMELMADLAANWSDEIDVVHSRHEQGAVAMADAYARSGDQVGVCIAGRGPGIAQTGTGILNARNYGSQLLVVAPEPAVSETHDVKTFEQESYLRTMVGDVVSIRSPETLVPRFGEALRRVFLGDSPLAVQISKDVLNGEIDVDAGVVEELVSEELVRITGDDSAVSGSPLDVSARLEPDPEKVSQAVDLYLDSDAFQPPVLIAGEGAYEAGAKEAMEELAERLNALLITSLKARDLFEGHPFHVGFSGNWGSPLANEFMTEANFVIAVGCSLNYHTVDEGYLIDDDATVIHVDADPTSIRRYTDVDLGIVGDARRTVEALKKAFEREGIDRGRELWTDDLRKRIEEFDILEGPEFPDREGAMDPRELIRTLNDVLPTDRLLGTDGGHFRKWVLDGITAPPDNSILSCDFAAIGLGLPMGVGIGQFLKDRDRFVNGGEDRTAVTICGDAGFMMSIQELETAVRNDISVIVVVMNDSALGAEYHAIESRGWPPETALMSTPDFATIAEGMGAEAHTANSIKNVEALADHLQDPDGPVVIDCTVNHEVRHRSY